MSFDIFFFYITVVIIYWKREPLDCLDNFRGFAILHIIPFAYFSIPCPVFFVYRFVAFFCFRTFNSIFMIFSHEPAYYGNFRVKIFPTFLLCQEICLRNFELCATIHFSVSSRVTRSFEFPRIPRFLIVQNVENQLQNRIRILTDLSRFVQNLNQLVIQTVHINRR